MFCFCVHGRMLWKTFTKKIKNMTDWAGWLPKSCSLTLCCAIFCFLSKHLKIHQSFAGKGWGRNEKYFPEKYFLFFTHRARKSHPYPETAKERLRRLAEPFSQFVFLELFCCRVKNKYKGCCEKRTFVRCANIILKMYVR